MVRLRPCCWYLSRLPSSANTCGSNRYWCHACGRLCSRLGWGRAAVAAAIRSGASPVAAIDAAGELLQLAWVCIWTVPCSGGRSWVDQIGPNPLAPVR